MKAKTSLKLSRMSVTNKIAFAKSIVTAMTGNADFPNPVPALGVVAQAASDLEDVYNSNDINNKAKTILLHTKEANLDKQLNLLALYVDSIAQGDATIITAAGMPVRAAKSAPHTPDAPQNIHATNTTVDGEIQVRWSKILNARVYVVEISTDEAVVQPSADNGAAVVNTTAQSFINWAITGIVVKTKYSIQGLSSGVKYAIRIYAIGAKGNSYYSLPVIAKAL